MIVPMAMVNYSARPTIQAGASASYYAASATAMNVFQSMNWRCDFSIVANPEQIPTTAVTGAIFCEFNTTDPYTSRGIYIHTNGCLYARGSTSNGYGYMDALDMRNICDGIPHNVTISRNGGNFTFTIDGMENIVPNLHGTTVMTGTSTTLQIGRYKWAGNPIKNGASRFRVWNIAFNGSSSTVKGTVTKIDENTGTKLYNTTGAHTFNLASSAQWSVINMSSDLT